MTASKTFREFYCESRHCSPGDYERQVFWATISRRSFPLLILVYWLVPSFFAREFELIRELARAQSYGEFRREVEAYVNRGRFGNRLRRVLKMRLAGRRLLRLARAAEEF